MYVILMLYCKICGTKNVYGLKCGSSYFTAHPRSWLIGVRLVHSWAEHFIASPREFTQIANLVTNQVTT